MKRHFYDENGNKLTYDCQQRINKYHGINGRVYKTYDDAIEDDLCIKLFNIGAILRIEEFKTIMNMDLDNFYKIYRILYNKRCKPKGYITKYYQPEGIDILTMPTDYTLHNFYALHNQGYRLSEVGIVIDDLHTGNVVLTKNGIIVLDVDNYYFGTIMTGHRVVAKNQNAINYLFRSLYYSALQSYHGYSANNPIVKELFSAYQRPDIVYKTLKRHKRPIDYIESRNK